MQSFVLTWHFKPTLRAKLCSLKLCLHCASVPAKNVPLFINSNVLYECSYLWYFSCLLGLILFLYFESFAWMVYKLAVLQTCVSIYDLISLFNYIYFHFSSWSANSNSVQKSVSLRMYPKSAFILIYQNNKKAIVFPSY